MGGIGMGMGADLAPIAAAGPSAPSPANRFAQWPVVWARALLAGLIILLIAAAWVPQTVSNGKGGAQAAKVPALLPGKGHAIRDTSKRDVDLALYDRVITRIRHGENYYAFIVSEHRAAHYPVRPGFAVRLPTLAYIDAAMGVDSDKQRPVPMAAAVALMLGVIVAWMGRLKAEGADERQRLFGGALIFLAASLGLNIYFFVLHELWAGMLIALSLGLHRPKPENPAQGKWVAAWLAAALALAIREHALPYVLLMGAMAVWRAHYGQGSRAEAYAWAALVAAFLGGMAWHLHLIAAQTLPSDPIGPSWMAMRCLGGWLSDVVLSSNLRFLPHWLAGPAVILMVFGWAGWKSEAGLTATLLYLGYGVLFMAAGRNDNYYWGAMVAPAMFIGLAFVPMALSGLLRACRFKG